LKKKNAPIPPVAPPLKSEETLFPPSAFLLCCSNFGHTLLDVGRCVHRLSDKFSVCVTLPPSRFISFLTSIMVPPEAKTLPFSFSEDFFLHTQLSHVWTPTPFDGFCFDLLRGPYLDFFSPQIFSPLPSPPHNHFYLIHEGPPELICPRQIFRTLFFCHIRAAFPTQKARIVSSSTYPLKTLSFLTTLTFETD